MRLLNIGIVSFILALVVSPLAVQGDDWNMATKFRVNRAVEIPGMVLEANTPYTIRLLDSPATRNVVQIYNEDQTEFLTMFIAISAERPRPADETVFTFIETEPGHPLPIKEWFYPGRLRGLEFVYPREQAMEIARHARKPVLAAGGDLHDLSTIEVEAIRPVDSRQPVTEIAANVEPETEPVIQDEPSVEQESRPVEPSVPAESSVEEEYNAGAQDDALNEPSPAVTDDIRELPATAGELPLIALIGLLCLGAGLGFRVLSTRS